MFTVIKADGTKEEFSDEKVLASIKRARIPQHLHHEVLNHIKTKLYDGISTSEIYQHILEFLDQSSDPYMRSRYSLKQAIMSLGPTGYPFEDFIARVLESRGYTTKVRQILSGRCVSHEIDVVAKKDGKTSIIEAKYHNNPGIRSDVHVALYTEARYQDVKEKNHIDDVWLVTNTKTTVDANTYAQCVGMKVISWSYPEGENLRDWIEQSHLYPVTMLTSISPTNKTKLLENHIVLCKDIHEDSSVLTYLPLTKEEREKILAEVAVICNQ